MSVDSLRASQIYAQISEIASQAPRGDDAPSVDRPDFGAVLREAVQSTAASISEADEAASAVAAGEANLVDVVTSISAAEVSLETAISIRNRMIEAYQEILRMPI